MSFSKKLLLTPPRQLLAVTVFSVLLLGCSDPTSDTIDANAGTAKKETQVEAAASDVQLNLDGDNCDIKWTGSNAVGMTPYGYFYDLEGSILLEGKSRQLKHLEVDIDMNGVKAMNESLTEKLKTHGFFEVDKFPTSRFVATSISDKPRADDPDGTTHVIEGNFQLRDVTKSITFPVTLAIEGNAFTLTSEFKINRKDFGVVYENATEDKAIRDNVLINIDIETQIK